MRAFAAAVLLALLPGLAVAQEPRAARSKPVPDLPSIGLPLPRIGLPLPRIGPPPPATAPSRVQRPAHRRGRQSPDRPRHRQGRAHTPRAVVYVVPAYLPSGVDAQADAVTPGSAGDTAVQDPGAQANASDAGTLRLELQPATSAQLFVDDLFIGTTDETGPELALAAGTHSVEVRADGYEPLRVNVRIEAKRTITYRGALVSLNAAPAAKHAAPARPAPAKRPAAARKPFYMIPGCYLGDVPPADAGLPKTCDPALAVTIWP